MSDLLNASFQASFNALLPIANAAPATVPAAGTPTPGWFSALAQFMPFILIAVLFYLILIAPQRRKQKETRRMIEAVEKGDRVVTIGGILGTVISVQDHEVTLKVDENSNAKIRFQKSAIASVEPRGEPEKK